MLFAIVLLLTIGCIAFILVRGAKGTRVRVACGGASETAAGLCYCFPSRCPPP
jgi:hypothetical protein